MGLFAGGSALVLGLGFGIQMATEVRTQLAAVEALGAGASGGLALASEIYDRQGAKVGEVGEERRYFVPLAQLPPHVPQAFISAEDKDFRRHIGVDPVAVVRAAVANLRGRKLAQGGSTITQQLARLCFLTSEKSWERKLKEAILALALERRLTKDRILELYLNKLYLGNRSYGVEAAARNYFRKDAADLSVGEAALLAGLPKSPSAYAPNRNPQRASERQAFVLRRMEEDGFLRQGDAKAWGARVVHVAAQPEDHWAKAPYFVVAVQRELARKLELAGSVPRQGLKIRTTLDGRLQTTAAAALAAAVRQAGRGAAAQSGARPKIEGAVFALDPRTGAVLASQGGSSFAKTQFDRSRSTRRRLGGLMVPIYMSLAFERGYTLASRIGDDPMDGRRQGPGSGAPTLFDAFIKGGGGLTFEAAPLFAALGAGSVVEHARRLGLEFDHDDLSLAVGTGEATAEEVARAYAAFVNGGRRVEPYLIDRIEAADGTVLYEAPTDGVATPAIGKHAAYITYHLLQKALLAGPARAGHGVSHGAGGLAAVTDDLQDAWFAGVLPNIATAVWLGAETGRARLGEHATAATLGLGVWSAMLADEAVDYVKTAPTLAPPDGLSFARVPGSKAASLPFVAGTEPRGEAAKF